MEQIEKNLNKECQNPNCSNLTNSPHSKYCWKCSVRHLGKNYGYKLNENIEIDLGNNLVGYLSTR